MSTLTLRAPSMLPSPRDIGSMSWSDRRPLDFPSRPRSQTDREELPSIRQIIPDFHQTRPGRTEAEHSTDSYSPTSGGVRKIPLEYEQSPSLNKRRRLSVEDEFEESRDRAIPRLYRSPSRVTARPVNASISPTSAARPAPGYPSDTRSDSNRSSPYSAASTTFQTFDAPRTQWRTLPRIPALAVETVSPHSRSNFGEYSLDSSRSGAQTYPQLATSAFNAPTPMSTYPQPSFSYGYQQPRGQSYSGPSGYSLSQERTPFSVGLPAAYPGAGYAYSGLDVGDGNDSKQKKRRGNLPKETTDKLRAWFINHLQHPYPTEDEKQELMRQTNLQMNQISNWFINARRRQLPAMINSARAETDARSARGGQGESTSDFGDEREKRGVSSDGDASGYDDEFELRSRRAKRDSI
ncbi:uncharacterized protein LY89DRAFT_731756 [Mollisia scopiformis]|uniref:Homeobox domain-containing protein n=1 Tax=Mollisia scopiformis TaxID=149040 RepID=A0A194XGT9_MOLSC|nr:uncharacterized protein LY89DRAFT_731756 [Mollisia scopiformis]KUJ19356.1 hypothetical protein LY89DRAFT_731756 [Mollisia scopiformis]